MTNESLSIWLLFANASLLVQLVMAGLLLVSIISWVLIFQRAIVLGRARTALSSFEDTFWSGMNLRELFDQLEQKGTDAVRGVETVFMAGFREFSRLRAQSEDGEAVMAGTERAMRVAMSREEERLDAHLPFLATVGSISPYIGLFGTVWGIMNTFRAVADQQQATLATVAPGISEALFATAMGLFAAIPAVIAFNRFSARLETLVSRYETFMDEFSSILHRTVHRSRKTS